MKGMELARRYYVRWGKAMLEDVLGAEAQRAAVGLVGEGSQCFGYDDEISQDHDFAPGFCIWLTQEDYACYGDVLAAAYANLPTEFLGFSRENLLAPQRLGVMEIGSFYGRFTGWKPPSAPQDYTKNTAPLPGVPRTLLDWLFTPEAQLAAATNGEIFAEGTGLFRAVREELLRFYPPDVWRKKLAARASIMAQAGQYNLLRALRRGDRATALLSLSRFWEAALSMVHLLNRRYTPFYKWASRSAASLPLLKDCVQNLDHLCVLASRIGNLSVQGNEVRQYAFSLIEEICASVATELNRQGLSASNSSFLQDHLTDLMAGIHDPQLAAMHPMIDCAN